MRRKTGGETTPDTKDQYEQSYGDAQAEGWAPRRRAEDLAERSRYSSQRDRQEDRSGFRRGFQHDVEGAELHEWGARHARGDEDGPTEDEELASEPAGTETVTWLERRRKATRRAAARKAGARKKTAARKAAPRKMTGSKTGARATKRATKRKARPGSRAAKRRR